MKYMAWNRGQAAMSFNNNHIQRHGMIIQGGVQIARMRKIDDNAMQN